MFGRRKRNPKDFSEERDSSDSVGDTVGGEPTLWS